jgi:hypothetical protein
MPTTVHITDQGDQNIGGNKTFTGVVTFSGQQVNLVDTALNLSGVGDMSFEGTNINFINSPVFISGTNLRVVGDVIGNNLVYNTGNQTIGGIKQFQSYETVFGNGSIGLVRITDDSFGGEFGMITNSDEVIAVKMSDGSFQYGGGSPGNAPIIVSSVGYVGIGTSNPTEILEVNGNLKLGGSSVYIRDTANDEYNEIAWNDNQLMFSNRPDNVTYGQRFQVLFHGGPLGEVSLRSNLNDIFSALYIPSGKNDYIALASEVVNMTENQIISGNKSFYGDVLLSGANTRIGGSDYIEVDPYFVSIKKYNGNLILSSEEYGLYDQDQISSIFWGNRSLNDPFGIVALDWSTRYLVNQNGNPVLYWTGENIGIGTNNPSEKLQVNGNILGDNLVYNTGNQTISGIKTFIGNHNISGNTTVSGSINISGNYDIYSQLENSKKLAIAYAIAL